MTWLKTPPNTDMDRTGAFAPAAHAPVSAGNMAWLFVRSQCAQLDAVDVIGFCKEYP